MLLFIVMIVITTLRSHGQNCDFGEISIINTFILKKGNKNVSN